MSVLEANPKLHLLRADYRLNRENSDRALEKGLAEADWYQTSVPRETMRELLARRDGPAIRDTFLWFGLIIALAVAAAFFWAESYFLGAAVCYAAYCALYASTSDSRWHESLHGTAFKTDWMNNALYEVASFMVMRESTIWRWSHTRHHSDTIIVGRDPEIAVPRPPDVKGMILGLFNLTNYPKYFKSVFAHASGRMSEAEMTFVPESEFGRVFFKARVYLAIYVGVLLLSPVTGSIVPVALIGVPHLFGSWLMSVYGYTQHAGLAENVLDHRLNCRTVYMNPLNRFLYWNMNYHLEHHMFPLVPYHALPKLHACVRHDCPTPYPGLLAAWREIIPALRRQMKDPAYFVQRELPQTNPIEAVPLAIPVSEGKTTADGWIAVCAASELSPDSVIGFEQEGRSYAFSRDAEGVLYATDGICTHGRTRLCEGLVRNGTIECPKHNGRFHLKDGSPARAPVKRPLGTYPVEERDGKIWFQTVRRELVAADAPEQTPA